MVFSLAVGTVLNYALGKYSGKFTGENQLFRAMHDLFEPNDVVLADRYYASFWDFALLDQRNVRLVTRQHQLRTTDFRRGTRLGEGDHLVTWAKPKQRPDWMDRETYQRLPDELVLREVHVRVKQRGFRVREYVGEKRGQVQLFDSIALETGPVPIAPLPLRPSVVAAARITTRRITATRS